MTSKKSGNVPAHEHGDGGKRYATDLGRTRVFDAYADEDWRVAHGRGHPVLVCPHRGCKRILVAVEIKRTGTRFFRLDKGGGDCGHQPDAEGGGGPQSRAHLRLTHALVATVNRIHGWKAVTKYTGLNAPRIPDIYVPAAKLCLEIQLRKTKYEKRTADLAESGAAVCWFIHESVGKGSNDALFGLPAVRFSVQDQKRKRVPLAELVDGTDVVGLRLQVWATVKKLSEDHRSWVAEPMDAQRFLREVLASERRYYEASEIGLKYGIWALVRDAASQKAMA